MLVNYGDWVKEGDHWWNKTTGDLLYPDGTMAHDAVYRGDAIKRHNIELFKHLESSEDDSIETI